VSPERISVEASEHVLLIGLNRPAKRNAFDLQMYQELGQALARLQNEAPLRCGVLFAHGEPIASGGKQALRAFVETTV